MGNLRKLHKWKDNYVFVEVPQDFAFPRVWVSSAMVNDMTSGALALLEEEKNWAIELTRLVLERPATYSELLDIATLTRVDLVKGKARRLVKASSIPAVPREDAPMEEVHMEEVTMEEELVRR